MCGIFLCSPQGRSPQFLGELIHGLCDGAPIESQIEGLSPSALPISVIQSVDFYLIEYSSELYFRIHGIRAKTEIVSEERGCFDHIGSVLVSLSGD